MLVGLPGCGKSSVGLGLAQQLGRRFLDFDTEIERRSGVTIRQIFAAQGEPRFRSLELDLTRELAAESEMVLAPGGGWATIPGAMAILRPPAAIVYLRAGPTVLVRRLGEERGSRPLLDSADPEGEMTRLLAMRERAYLAADYVVDVELLGLQDVIDEVRRLVSPLRGA